MQHKQPGEQASLFMVIIVILAMTCPVPCQGALYNIDLKSTTSVYSGKGILGTLAVDTVWNGIMATNTNAIALKNSTGGTSALTFGSNSIAGNWNSSFGFGWGDFSDYWLLKTNGTGTLTINDAPSGEQYVLLLYCFGPADGRVMRASVNGGGSKETSGQSTGVIQWATIPDPESNYLQFTGVVPGDGKITINLTCVGSEADIQGLQLQIGAMTPPLKGMRTYKLGADLKAGYDLKVMSVGTSLTDLPYGVSWPTQLQAALWNKYQGREILSNRAVSSTDSRHGVANITGWLASDNPDVVFIEYAINDALGIPYDEVRSNLDFMVAAILANNPNADIILQTMSNCTGNSLTTRPNLEAYYQLYRDYAAQRGLTLIDNYPLWKSFYDTNPAQWSVYVSDGIHPNNEGRIAVGVIANMADGIDKAYPRVAKPVFAHSGGTQPVTITSTTAGAVIYYTLDGKIPTLKSAVYSSPVTIPSGATIKAIALKVNMTASVVASAAYGTTGAYARVLAKSAPLAYSIERNILSVCVPLGAEMDLTMVTMQGRSVYNRRLSQGYHAVDMHTLAAGNYRLILHSGACTELAKVVIMR